MELGTIQNQMLAQANGGHRTNPSAQPGGTLHPRTSTLRRFFSRRGASASSARRAARPIPQRLCIPRSPRMTITTNDNTTNNNITNNKHHASNINSNIKSTINSNSNNNSMMHNCNYNEIWP